MSLNKSIILIGRLFAIVGLVLLALVMTGFLNRKHIVPLAKNGSVATYGTRPFAWPGKDVEYGIFSGKKMLFSLWCDSFDTPVFIYPFPDGRRFLCIDDDDTAMLVFVVDLDAPKAKPMQDANWPADEYQRNYLEYRMREVVMQKGITRLPVASELGEVTRYLSLLSQDQIDAASYPAADFGIWQSYSSKNQLLANLALDRKSLWP